MPNDIGSVLSVVDFAAGDVPLTEIGSHEDSSASTLTPVSAPTLTPISIDAQEEIPQLPLVLSAGPTGSISELMFEHTKHQSISALLEKKDYLGAAFFALMTINPSPIEKKCREKQIYNG